MASNLQTLLEEIKSEALAFRERNHKLERELRSSQARVSELEQELAELREDYEKRLRDNEFLILSHRLAKGPENLVRSRQVISKMIRDIDKSISQLKE